MLRTGITGAVTVFFALTVGLAFRAPSKLDSGSRPSIVLWAWERPELLGFIDPEEIEVAVLAGTLTLTADSVTPRPRLQPLELPRAARRSVVVRIESDRAGLTPAQRRQTVAAILAWTRASPEVAGVQIDFDATVSERPFYRSMLEDLRRELPATVPLSMTALASWCLGDRWLEGLPIDELMAPSPGRWPGDTGSRSRGRHGWSRRWSPPTPTSPATSR